MGELKACPCCRGGKIISTKKDAANCCIYFTWGVFCAGCGLRIEGRGQEAAEAAWSRRDADQEDDLKDRQIEALSVALEVMKHGKVRFKETEEPGKNKGHEPRAD